VISSHILLELAEVCTNIAILQDGRLVLSGDVDTLSQHAQPAANCDRLLESSKILDALELLRTLSDVISAHSGEDETIYAEFSGNDHGLHLLLQTLLARELPVIAFSPRSAENALRRSFELNGRKQPCMIFLSL